MTQQFSASGPVEAAVRLGSGRVTVEACEPQTAAADVVPLDPGHEPSARLAASAEIRFDGDRLTVRVPEQGRLFRRGEVLVRLALPPSSSLAVKGGSVDITVDGGLEELEAKIGAGEVQVDTVDALVVKGGQVDVVVDHAGALSVSTGQGTLRADSVGDAAFKTGHGEVALGRTHGNVVVKGGAVQLSVREAIGGEVYFQAGAGNATVAVQTGTAVELDLTSGAGDVRCELPVESSAPAGGAGLRLRLRTGSGDLVVRSTATEPTPAGG
jgi:hypothetical protein